MTPRAIVAVLTLLLVSPLAPGRAAAQDADGARLPAMTLPVNLERVKRKLAALPSREDGRSFLDLNYYLEVYGRAPRLDVLEGFDTHFGPAPFGGPTHTDMRDLWTPEEFSSPAVDLGSLFDWLLKR